MKRNFLPTVPQVAFVPHVPNSQSHMRYIRCRVLKRRPWKINDAPKSLKPNKWNKRKDERTQIACTLEQLKKSLQRFSVDDRNKKNPTWERRETFLVGKTIRNRKEAEEETEMVITSQLNRINECFTRSGAVSPFHR